MAKYDCLCEDCRKYATLVKFDTLKIYHFARVNAEAVDTVERNGD